MKPVFLLSWPGEYVTGTYPQPDDSNHTSSTLIIKVNFNIILPPTPRSPESFSLHVTFAVYLILLELVNFLIFIEQYKSLFISLWHHVSYCLLGPSFPPYSN
jgi:hypothetical protein